MFSSPSALQEHRLRPRNYDSTRISTGVCEVHPGSALQPQCRMSTPPCYTAPRVKTPKLPSYFTTLSVPKIKQEKKKENWLQFLQSIVLKVAPLVEVEKRKKHKYKTNCGDFTIAVNSESVQLPRTYKDLFFFLMLVILSTATPPRNNGNKNGT